MKTFKIFLISISIFLLFVLSEVVYTLNNRDVLSSYLLNTADFLSKKGNTPLAFYILTEGQIKLPENEIYKNEVKKFLENVPEKYDLSRVTYELALMAYKDNEQLLTPGLLNASINRDPDFSFWRVELANYYLLNNQPDEGRKTLKECENLIYPRKHCLDYENQDFRNAISYQPGFLSEAVNKFYQTNFR